MHVWAVGSEDFRQGFSVPPPSGEDAREAGSSPGVWWDCTEPYRIKGRLGLRDCGGGPEFDGSRGDGGVFAASLWVGPDR